MSGPIVVWVRRCASCDIDDLHAAYGQPSIIGRGPWRCRDCGCREWVPSSVELPDDAGAACPYTTGRR